MILLHLPKYICALVSCLEGIVNIVVETLAQTFKEIFQWSGLYKTNCFTGNINAFIL